jgi:hypothetical protein
MGLTEGVRKLEVSSKENGKLKNSTETKSIGNGEFSVLDFQSQISDEVIGISDIPIFRISKVEEGEVTDDKPVGSAYVIVDMNITLNPEKVVKTRVCVDTGADMTICSHTFLIQRFGEKSLETFVKTISNPPRLKSASGHPLKVFGCVDIDLYLGEYKMTLGVMVYENKADFLLLGADAFYNRLVFDRGKFLIIAKGEYPPIPIIYQLENSKACTVHENYVAPKSSALIKVCVSTNTQMIGQEVVLTPEENEFQLTPFRETVSTIERIDASRECFRRHS